MDRRKQRGLSLAAFALVSFLASQRSDGQEATPAPSPTASPKPATTERKVAPSFKPVPLPLSGKPGEDPAVQRDEIAARMRKARRQEIERFLDGKGGEEPSAKLLEQLPPGEDREAFRRNLMRWRDLPPGERQALRGQADNRGERIKAETDAAIKEAGLRLTPDQREVFALRYTQERRKLERALLDQMNSERSKRLPKIVEQLRKEFPQTAAPTPGPSGSPAPTPTPKPAQAAPSSAASPTPSVG